MSQITKLPLDDSTWKDERGWGVNLLDALDLHGHSLGDLHVVTLEPNKIRGNHVHPDATEYLLVCSGPVRLSWTEGRGDTVAQEVIEGDMPMLISIPLGIPHAIENLAAHPVILVALAADPVRTTLPHTVV